MKTKVIEAGELKQGNTIIDADGIAWNVEHVAAIGRTLAVTLRVIEGGMLICRPKNDRITVKVYRTSPVRIADTSAEDAAYDERAAEVAYWADMCRSANVGA